MQRGIGGIGKIVERVQQGSVKIEDGGVMVLFVHSDPLKSVVSTVPYTGKGNG